MNDRPFAHRRVIAAALLALLASTGALAQEPAPRAATETAVRIVPDDLFHVEFVGEGRAWITGYHGTVLRSDDAGASWTNVSLDSHQLLRRGAFPSREHAWLVGHRGSIFHSADGGETWVRSHHEPGIYLRDIAFLDERRGWAVGHEGTILHTRDGGQGWHKQPLSDWTRRDLPRLSGIAIVDAQRLVATGEFGTLAYTQIFNTANGQVTGAPVRLASMGVGPIVFRDVGASVNGGKLDRSLLGMSFLNRLSGFEIEGDRMTLRP